MELSIRLERICTHIDPNKVIADIGTDHGQLPVYMVVEKGCKLAYAADISKNSLKKAEGIIQGAGLEKSIIAKVSNGFEALLKEPIQVGIIAGMGGGLVAAIISQELPNTLDTLICSPHSEIDKVRKAIHHIGFTIETEEMVFEEGQYYTIIKAVKGIEQGYSSNQYKYGKCLIESKDPMFIQYLNYKLEKLDKLLKHLKIQVGECASARENEIVYEANEIKEVLRWVKK